MTLFAPTGLAATLQGILSLFYWSWNEAGIGVQISFSKEMLEKQEQVNLQMGSKATTVVKFPLTLFHLPLPNCWCPRLLEMDDFEQPGARSLSFTSELLQQEFKLFVFEKIAPNAVLILPCASEKDLKANWYEHLEAGWVY